MKKLRVGLCIRIDQPTESLFTNGIKQNAITMWHLFHRCANVGEVFFVNLGKQRDLSASPWRTYERSIIDFDTALEKLDVLIMLTVILPNSWLERLKDRGIRIVAHIMGPEYHQLMECILFDGTPIGLDFLRRVKHDVVWMSPHIFGPNKDLFEVTTDAPARIAPYVWNTEFVAPQMEQHALKKGVPPRYQARSGPKQVSVFEPNLNVVKTCLTPLLALEKAFRKAPDRISAGNIFGTDRIAKKKSLIEFVSGMELQKSKKVFFEGRYSIAFSLLNYTDIVLSHQRDLELNYLYFDAAWYGYPVVHNSDALRDLGFHYPGFDAEIASEKVLEAITCSEDPAWVEDYMARSRKIISRFLWDQPENIAGYERLLAEVAGS